MSIYQMAWIKAQVDADRREREDLQLHQIEYLASFMNPEGVRQVQGDRSNSRRVTDDNFLRAVASLSGVDAASEVAKIGKG